MRRALGDELCRRAGLECEWALHDWEALIPDLGAERFDVILAGMSITAEREALIDFAGPYYPPQPSLYLARAGEGEGALGGRVGVTEHTIYSACLEERGVACVPLAGAVAAAAAVLARARWTPCSSITATPLRSSRSTPVGSRPSVRRLRPDRGLGIGVRTGSDLLGAFNEALEAMRADGTLNALIRRWLGEDAATFE